jgi:acylphosphatase
MADIIITRHLIISGRVQGVGFRAFVHHHAEKLELDGFVRNLRDGTVEALIMGEADRVEALISACREGPPASRVEKVEISNAEGIADKGFKHFPTV